ncbi:transmembrane 220 family protein [Flavimarina sp. Hel_I_48]|uniref:transmembrane 220 family protein n=1 Tax=Flavimarina sp. Hel_I_48 TaxID=1392488 RepID=UPI0004DF9CED|nr:transmembrane 220 family protein [Flavimarina sp. Hel_I_48]
MKTFFYCFAAVFAILFGWAAFLQNNDPDAFLWYCIYGSAAVGCVLFIAKKLNFLIAYILAVSYVIGAFLSWPAQFEGVAINGGDIDNIEHAREALGLLINAAVLIILALRIQWLRNK